MNQGDLFPEVTLFTWGYISSISWFSAGGYVGFNSSKSQYAKIEKAEPILTLLMYFFDWLRLLFKQFLSVKSSNADKSCYKEEHSCRFGDGLR